MTTSVKWHTERRKMLMSDAVLREKLRAIPRLDHRATVFIVLIPVATVAATALAARVSWPTMVLMAATVGAFLNFSTFHYGHEICHRTVPFCKSERARTLWFFYLYATVIGGMWYLYYRWNHLNHHRHQGRDPLLALSEEVASPLNFDVDVIGLTPFLDSPLRLGEDRTSVLPAKSGIGRRAMLAVVPLVEIPGQAMFVAVTGFMMRLRLWLTRNDEGSTPDEDRSYVPKLVLLLSSFQMGMRNRHIAHRDEFRIHSNSMLAISLCWITTFTASVTFFGVQGGMYLLISQAFARGFLYHPYFAFWQSIHADPSHLGLAGEQPTVSTYGKTSDVIMFNLNRHTEHHDFPKVPGRHLARITDVDETLYRAETFNYRNIFDFYRVFFSNGGDWVYRVDPK